ncbi:carboxylesterase family protein [Altererythrobacter sp. KTW20L]|uniref:carboxylesterase/lipase family protein n=1 Tax=Altererythrobacter sp. KTW20L TaxID=2942210 RepID=UPI0020BDF123|nr:carboxylesterase family protein [Altererythrobacter sp. KTW20L]MCL6250757.1 carboxylesterase family protein [Altererythrobacter sp. KTW20L]
MTRKIGKTAFARSALVALMMASVGACATADMAVAQSTAAGTSMIASGPVQTEQGMVRGVPGALPGITVFKGLPFAAPPVGDLRWEQPQPAASWTGVRMADTWGDSCVQNPAPTRFPPNSATDMPDSPGISEDCLYLNVWTPAASADESLPVMVWIYGGAYNEGGGSAPFSHGDQLAAKGVVLITLNYRVGSLGFFSHPELTAASPHGASGNQALGDSIAALQWIQDNIEAFGGDPSRVTIFGESAGAAIAGGLVGAPPARDLVHRAIPQSGAWMGLGIGTMVPRERAEAQVLQQAQEQFGTTSLAELRAQPATEIHAKIRGAGMIVDGHIIPEDVSIAVANNRQNPWDVLAGSNEDEGSFTGGMGPAMTLERYNAGEAQRYGAHVDLGRAAYPASSDEEAALQAQRPFSDGMSWHMRQYADGQARLGRNAFLYFFTHDPLYDPDKPDLGAAHTGEIPYVFNNLCAPRTFPGGSSVELMCGNPREEGFADQVSQYWVNFAATGNPNGPGLPHWPASNELPRNQVMRLDADGSGVGPWLTPAQDAFYAAQFNERVAGPLGIPAAGQ